MAMRMTGLVSGMDTESMVKELVSASSEKVNKIKQKKQDVEWKKEIWSGLNTKIYNFYKTQLSAFKSVSNYKTKKATASDETMIEEFAQRIAQSGLTMEQYLQFSGMTVDQLKDQVRPEATTRIQSSLVLEQIAKEENIEVTDADIDAEVEKMAKAYGMEADKLKEYMGDAEKESMKKDLAITKAVDLIMDNVKERAKAKKKADAEESTEE